MRYSTARLNIVYERPFRQPVFQVARSAAEFLESLYGRINPKYPIGMADLTAAHSSSMADVAVRGRLFAGNGLIELNVDRLTARFEGLRNQQDIETVRDVITLSEEALENVIPDIDYHGAIIRTSAWLKCDKGEQGVNALLSKFGTPKIGLKPEEFGAEKIGTPIRGQLENTEEGWSIAIIIEPSALAEAHLFFLCDGTYAEEGKFDRFDGRAGHLVSIYGKLLAHYGLEPISD